MATAADDDYSAASGADVYAGRFSVPLWRQGIAVNEWVEIAGSSLSANPPSVQPTGGGGAGVSGIIDTWCGLCIDSRDATLWSLANGGHTDYYGNQVLKQALGVDAPVWSEVLASETPTMPNNAGRYASGLPASVHSYYTQQFVEQRNRAMRFGATAVANSGNTFSNVDGFDCTVTSGNGWDAASTYPDVPADANGATAPDQVTCKDPSTGDVYSFMGNNSVRKWTQSTNAWSLVNVGFPPIAVTAGPVAWDTARDRIFFFRGGTSHHTFNPADGSFTSQTMDYGAITDFDTAKASPGMVYEPALDAYLVRLGGSGGAVYAIDAGSFVMTELTTTGGSALPATRNISGSPQNVYGRFLYAPTLGGVVYVPKYSENTWFLRTH